MRIWIITDTNWIDKPMIWIVNSQELEINLKIRAVKLQYFLKNVNSYSKTQQT